MTAPVDVAGFVERLWRDRVTAIVRTTKQEAAALAMAAAVRGGFRHLEFTLTTPGALELITEFSRRKELVAGAGTVMTPADAENAVRAGAQFLVTPVLDVSVVAAAHRLGVPILPGVHTPTEMWQAHQAGATLLKIFPAVAGGPAAVRAILAPMPFLKLVPTNGVDAGNAAAYLEAGAVAVGLVNPLFEPDFMAAGRWDDIEERAREVLRAVARVERPDLPPPENDRKTL